MGPIAWGSIFGTTLLVIGCSSGSGTGTYRTDGGNTGGTANGGNANQDASSGGQTAMDSGYGAGGESSCVTNTVVLADSGQSSACAFDIPVPYDAGKINVFISTGIGGGQTVCARASANCGELGGWFWFGDQIALCDATCVALEQSGTGMLIAELGCDTDPC